MRLRTRLTAGRTWRVLVAAAVAGSAAVVSPAAVAARPATMPYSEIGMPAGRYVNHAPAGWVLTIHEGGWRGVGVGATELVSPAAAWLNRAGWATLNIDYRAGADSEVDVRAFYDQLRARVGPRTPICALGQSAGAQLAMMLAARRPRVACVISEGGPSDLAALANQTAYDPTTGGQWRQGPLLVLTLAMKAFGEAGLVAHSPVTYAPRIRAAVLASQSTHDALLPRAQLDVLREALPSARTMALENGHEPFVHAGISTSAVHAYNQAKRVLLNDVTRATRRASGARGTSRPRA